MATVTITGVDQVLKRFEKMAAAAEPVFEKAAEAGGQMMARLISADAPVRTGGVAKSIRSGKVKHTVAEGFHCEVEPTGNDPHGEPYAKIVNILEYSEKRGHPFFYASADAHAAEVQSAMGAMVSEGLTKQ